jgi:hypothetical protein
MRLCYNLFNNNSVEVENKKDGLRFTLNHKNYDSPEQLRWNILFYYKPMYFGFEKDNRDFEKRQLLKKHFEEEIQSLEKEIEKYKMLINVCSRRKIDIINNCE